MATNVLGEDKTILGKIRDEVTELEKDIERERALSAKEEGTEAAIESKEKLISGEISDTVKRRREELEETFDTEEKKLDDMSKKVQTKREKMRHGEVSKRIDSETESFYEENRTLKADAKKLFKQEKVPSIWNTGLYYSLFFPRGLTDLLRCLLAFLICFAAIPLGIWSLVPKPTNEFYLVLLYLACIVIFGGLYLLVFTKTRAKYRETLLKGNNIRLKRRNNLKVIGKISKKIKKDKDDSTYGLEDYDRQLEDFSLQREDLNRKKKEALQSFDERTRGSIAEEIRSGYQVETDALAKELTSITEELAVLRERIKERSIFVSENYETFLGKDMVKGSVLNELLLLMEARNLPTIGEAIEAYKQKGNEGQNLNADT